MRLALLSLVAAAAAVSPALANEARVEARTSIVFDSGFSTGAAGVAAGYDFDLGDMAFAGLEVSGDKLLDRGTRVSFGATGRLGLNVAENTKGYVLGGYASKPCKFCEDGIAAGAGVQHSFGKIYVKAEYRHIFANNNAGDLDIMLTGIGTKF